MTILQPFEQTKIVVNLDKAPAEMWSCLFKSSSTTSFQPRYMIPAVRPFGYLRNVPVTDVPKTTKGANKSQSHVDSAPKTTPVNPRTRLDFESLWSMSQSTCLALPKNNTEIHTPSSQGHVFINNWKYFILIAFLFEKLNKTLIQMLICTYIQLRRRNNRNF